MEITCIFVIWVNLPENSSRGRTPMAPVYHLYGDAWLAPNLITPSSRTLALGISIRPVPPQLAALLKGLSRAYMFCTVINSTGDRDNSNIKKRIACNLTGERIALPDLKRSDLKSSAKNTPALRISQHLHLGDRYYPPLT